MKRQGKAKLGLGLLHLLLGITVAVGDVVNHDALWAVVSRSGGVVWPPTLLALPTLCVLGMMAGLIGVALLADSASRFSTSPI